VQPIDLRSCVEAPRGQRIFGEDFNQQELRLLAHFAGGPLLAGYRANPRMDMHAFAQKLINGALDANYARWQIKNTGFMLIYGGGLNLLAKKVNTNRSTAQLLKRAYLDRLGLRDLDERLKRQDHVVTWGGRICPVEPPVEKPNGEYMTWEYKNLNTLIQGSAADLTKQSMIDFAEQYPEHLMIQVHDENVGLCPTREVKRVRRTLSSCMSDQPNLELSFPTDGAHGKTWRECK
jgi:DNA polymerase-1